MTLAIATLLVLALLSLLLALGHAVRADGYGRRPPPRSHPAWYDGLPPAPPAR